MPYTKAELYEKFENLPDEIQEAFLSVNTYETIKKIVDQHNLHVDQAGQLSQEIGYVMLGVTRPEVFLSQIAEKVGVPMETAGEIVKEINSSIFFPIRTALQGLNNGGTSIYRSDRAPMVENFSPAGSVSQQNIPKPETPLQNPNNNAIIMGNIPIKNPDQRIFDEKMGKLFRLPKEEVDLGGINGQSGRQSNTNKVSDPYKEPI